MVVMVKKKSVLAALNNMILSASGWRGIFAIDGNDESAAAEISPEHRIIATAAAMVFVEYLHGLEASPQVSQPSKRLKILLGSDTRPTGAAVIDAMIPVLLAKGCEVRYSGFTAAPEIMAWARSEEGTSGFIYISASHNPIGHNGIKFGLTDGGVLAAREAVKLIADFRSFFNSDDCVEKIESLISTACPVPGNFALSCSLEVQVKKVYADEAAAKVQALKFYHDFCNEVAWNGSTEIAAVLKESLAGSCAASTGIAASVASEKKQLGVVCDFNGSARAVSIDREFFSALGLKFDSINSRPGEIAHRIVPEGESLEPCKLFLEKKHKDDASFLLGYVPDCDGDRGNLVIWDDSVKSARALEAQEVFALACVAEFAHLVWTGDFSYDGNGRLLGKAAVVVNDPTSMRIDRIAEAFGVSVFRAEVGEANVVGLARNLRNEGYTVRILGEGSAGGNITHPSAVRDPINTVLAIVKLLSVCSVNEKSGLFEIWCKHSGQMEKYRTDFSLADVIASLPPFASTPSYSEKAILRINTQDHALLKDRYQQIFLREWAERKDELKRAYGFSGWEAAAYNGLEEKRQLNRFGEAGKGGLRICFKDEQGREAALIWMRGSATEPVFRIMADAENTVIERFLLDWQRNMIIEADKGV